MPGQAASPCGATCFGGYAAGRLAKVGLARMGLPKLLSCLLEAGLHQKTRLKGLIQMKPVNVAGPKQSLALQETSLPRLEGLGGKRGV